LDFLKLELNLKISTTKHPEMYFGGHSYLPLRQACQTQTTLRAAKALKTAKGAAKVLKSPQCGPYLKKSID